MNFDPTTNRVAFGLMTEEERAVMTSWPYGWEYFSGEKWHYSSMASRWSTAAVYRGKPAPLVPDSIDWSHVSDEFVCMARDADGDVYLYAGAADISGSLWSSEHDYTSARGQASYRKGTVQWNQSLVWRPGHEPKDGSE